MNTIFYKRKFWGGLLFIAAGIILLLKTLNIITFEIPPYVFSWKMLLLVVGLLSLFSKHWFSGLLMTAAGIYFLLPEAFGIYDSNMAVLWSMLLIVIGIRIVGKTIFPDKKKIPENNPFHRHQLTNDYMDSTVLFGGDMKKIISHDFKGGRISAICGGLELDLSNCTLSKEINIIEVFILMGGVTLKVPKEWHVRTEANPVMGGIEDNTSDRYIDPAAELIIRGSLIMGGMEIQRV